MRFRPETGMGKRLLIVFLVCVLFYVAWFRGMEFWRQRRGPWEIGFRAEGSTNALVQIAHPRLAIRDVQIRIVGARLPAGFTAQTIRFDGPEQRSRVPFGQVRFLDTTFLPGTVTLEVFGHEIELLPRVLIVNKTEHPWRNGLRLELPAHER